MAGRTMRRPSRTRDDADARDERDDSPDDQPEERSSRRSSRPTRRSAPTPREEERPSRSSRRSRDDDDSNDTSVRGGWGAWRENKQKMSNFGEEFKVDYKRKYLIRLLDDAPFATFGQHWLDDMPKGEKKSYVCLGEDCPLCDILNDSPRALAVFNVVEFVTSNEGTMPKLKYWQMGSGVAQILEEYADDPKTSPINDFYWQVSKTKSGGKNGPTNYQISAVKDRDVEDDWNTDPLTDEELEEFEAKKFGPDFIRRDSAEALEEIARNYVGD